MRFQLSSISLLSFAICTFAATPAIIHPANGTHIALGSPFDFKYNTRADYGVTSYNYTVRLITSEELSKLDLSKLGKLNDVTTGYYFGTFAESNYPGGSTSGIELNETYRTLQETLILQTHLPLN